MKDELIISAHGSHNASIAMYYQGNYTVVEVERWLNKKNAGLLTYLPAAYPQITLDEITEFLLSKTGRTDVDVYMTNYADLNKIKPKFSYNKYIKFDHHLSHAACAFYQSPYQESLVFTFDGGGDAGFFNVYKASRRDGIQLVKKLNQDLGFAYMIIANYLSDIKKDPLNIGNLVYAGKLMGLCSYGKVREEWLPAFKKFYRKFNYIGNSYIGGLEVSKDAVPQLMTELGIKDFNYTKSRFSDEVAWDLAATTQAVFEDEFFRNAEPFLQEYPDLPVTLAGGCALNVILNEKILERKNGNVFVPPNTSDCGIAVGGILWYKAPESQVDLTYAGVPILDSMMFSSYIENGNFSLVQDVSLETLAAFIGAGNIVGVINENSEHGPRALGNRSILCTPVGDMKNVLNQKVKNREWYRPFAPVTRLEDAPTYFEFPENAQSRHMTFVSKIREEWREKLPAITHEDSTGRLQTVTRQQNSFIYDLLTEFKKVAGHGVLLNTSFNVNGKPILSRISDALDILAKTKLDAVFYNNNLIFRKGEEEKLTRNIISENIKPLDESTTVYLTVFCDNTAELHKKYLPMLDKATDDLDNVVIICDEKSGEVIKDRYDFAEIYPIRLNQLFYHELIQEKIPDIKFTQEAFYPLVYLLWIKGALYKNYHRTKYHLFANLNDLERGDVDLLREIKMLLTFTKEDEEVIISSKPFSLDDSPFDERFIKEYTDELPKYNVTSSLFAGNIQNIEWLSVNYEGMLLEYLRDSGKIGIDKDYLLMAYLRNPQKFKVLTT